MYMGKQQVKTYDLLFGPDNSLIRQSWDPKLMTDFQNLAGFGMIGWNDQTEHPNTPYFYKTEELPFFDANLLNLSKKIAVNTLLAHVRGVPYTTDQVVTRQNTHPFLFDGYQIALAHNGHVEELSLLKGELAKHIKEEELNQIAGSTDSELIYSLFVSQIKEPKKPVSLEESREALIRSLQILRECRQKVGAKESSPVNLFVTNGEYALATRFVYDYGSSPMTQQGFYQSYHSLWYTYGDKYSNDNGMYKMLGAKEKNNLIIASEPLSEDRTTWVEVPEYSLMTVWWDKESLQTDTMDLNI